MLKYLYIPEKFDLDEYIDFAVSNNFNQIIHGKSDIINNLILDYNEVQEIKIPEYKRVLNKSLVFKEKESFKLTLLDEFVINNEYNISSIEIYRLDDIDLNKKQFVLQKNMERINECVYEVEVTLDLYGEYVYEIFYEVDRTARAVGESVLLKDSIIIYKEYEENEGAIDDRFFFN
jgi:hypothetical protein